MTDFLIITAQQLQLAAERELLASFAAAVSQTEGASIVNDFTETFGLMEIQASSSAMTDLANEFSGRIDVETAQQVSTPKPMHF